MEQLNLFNIIDDTKERFERPTAEQIVKMIDKTIDRHSFLSDVIECGAIAISNRFDYREDREQQYLKIINKYDRRGKKLLLQVFTKIYILLSSQLDYEFNDYLGKIFMLADVSNKHTGQFFTPYDVSKACVKCSINKEMLNKEIITVSEPSCGAGGMVVALADVLLNEYDFNYSRNMVVECSDIDRRCVLMTYLQLSLIGMPSIIYHRDTLTMQTWDRWKHRLI